MTTTAHYNRIIIIQSLNQGLTGTRLQDDLNILTISTNGIVSSELIDVQNKVEFMTTLSNICLDVTEGKYRPVIHIEAHGAKDCSGLVLASGGPEGFVSWQELKVPLAEINKATRLNLIVCISACNGAYLAKAIETVDIAPCWALVGPKKVMYDNELLRDFTRFYGELIKTQSGGSALKRLNNDVTGPNAPYFFTSAEWFFEHVWINYIRDFCNNAELNNRANSLIRALKKKGMKDPPSRNQLKSELLRRQPDDFMKSKEKYFMMDLFPENKNRFSVDYKEVLREASVADESEDCLTEDEIAVVEQKA